MKLTILSAVLLLALSGCTSRQSVPLVCPPLESMPAELMPEPQNLAPLLRLIIYPMNVYMPSSSDYYNSAGQN